MRSSPDPHIAAALDDDAIAALMEPLTALVIEAGAAVLAVRRGALDVAHKTDGSPVTAADLAADRIIVAGLARIAPSIAAISEERITGCEPATADPVFLVDPLDGTKEFVAGRDEFTVNIALVAGGTPVLGVVGAPALGLLWRGQVGRGAERIAYQPIAAPTTGADAENLVRTVTAIRTRPWPGAGAPWVAAVSRSHQDQRSDAFIAARPGARRRVLGSAIKLCRVADGEVDIYPRLSPTSEWDIAAGHAVVVAAGGIVTDGAGRPLRYGTSRPGFVLPEMIAWGDPAAMR